MTALVLDAGALVAIDRGDRAMRARLELAEAHGDVARTNAMVVAQVWRDARGKQTLLARALQNTDIRSVDPPTGRAAAVLLGTVGTSDPVDATVVLLAEPGDQILTSDVGDIGRLVTAAEVRATVVPC
jgi:ribosomal protein L18